MTSIEWTEATWNPIAGCSVLSPGCTNCYAMRTAARLARIEATAPIYAGLTQPSKAGPVWTGKIAVNEKAMLEPLRRRKPTMYFVNSMSDLFHESVPDEVIDRVFAVMALCGPRRLPSGKPWKGHTFQLLTKRSARMRTYLSRHRWHLWAAIGRAMDPDRWASLKPVMGGDCTPMPNVWLGVSVEDQKRADERIPDLLATPAAVRFLSCEPLLGLVDLTRISTMFVPHAEYVAPLEGRSFGMFGANGPAVPSIDWVIVGGESGPGARPMHPDWARSLRDQCAAAGVPFFFKQWGEWMPAEAVANEHNGVDFVPPLSMKKLTRWRRWDGDQCRSARKGESVNEFFEPGILAVPDGKKAAGRLLDGVTHDAMPQVRP
jgi:protein gp37